MRENPYLLLGVDYGTSAAGARRAFARAQKRLRRNPDSGITREDLTAALHRIESDDGDPFDEVDLYRVPADPSVFTPDGTGVLRPPPVPKARATDSDNGRAARAAAAHEIEIALDTIIAASTSFDVGYRFEQGGSA